LKVPISEIRPPRGKLRNPRNVQVYAQRLRSGEQAPPVMLWRMKTGLFKFYIEDGDHRYLAARSIGATTIEARVMPGYIEFFQRNGYVCHRIVEHAEPRPAKPPRRPTKKRGSGTRAGRLTFRRWVLAFTSDRAWRHPAPAATSDQRHRPASRVQPKTGLDPPL
jgi:ParB/Sulfiredoxin domain